MIHDQDLLDRLSRLQAERFSGEVFRATRASTDPLAFSNNGGRWGPPAKDSLEVPVLYTSLSRNGALAEVVSYLVEQSPMPKSRPLKVSRLRVSTSQTLRVMRDDLEQLGVDMARYGERDYVVTQNIGAALSFLEIDGLIAPSARWDCNNLMLFQSNHQLGEVLEVLESEEVDWYGWAQANELLPR